MLYPDTYIENDNEPVDPKMRIFFEKEQSVLAYKYAQQAADLDDVLGYVFVAMLHKNGYGVKKNKMLAVKYFVKAAD